VTTTLGADQVRRIVLGAQGFAKPRPTGGVTVRHATALLDRVAAVQLDSVNVVARAHELTFFARLGDHPRDLAARLIRRGDAFEFWGHEASLIDVRLQPALRWRMEEAKRGAMWGGLVEVAREHPEYVDRVREAVRDRGPISARHLEDRGVKPDHMWGWDRGKKALEYLFWTGEVTAWRTPTFERVYDLTERALPRDVVDAPTPSEADARKILLLRAARAFGVATAADLADAFRQKRPVVRPLVAELVEDGALEEVRVEGWRTPAYRIPGGPVPRRVDACALLTPFDSLMWERDRVERIFGFRYRIEIYVPAPKRIYGYYVLPFLLGDRLVARIDAKADRRAGVLRIAGAWGEAGIDLGEVVTALAGETRDLAGFLGLDGVAVGRRGDLADPLRARLTRA
jgi:uncharacterized protein YcaQ